MKILFLIGLMYVYPMLSMDAAYKIDPPYHTSMTSPYGKLYFDKDGKLIPLWEMKTKEEKAHIKAAKLKRKVDEQKRKEACIEIATAAAASGRVEWLKIIGDTYINEPNAKGATPLFYACQNGHYEVVEYLLPKLRTATEFLWLNLPSNPKTPCTALHIAAQKGHTKIVELLLDDDTTNANSQHAPYSQLPLHCALRHGHQATAIALLERGGYSIQKDELGNTPLSLAAQFEYDPLLTEAFSYSLGITFRAREGNLELMKALLTLKPNLEKTDPTSNATPLIWAAKNGHTEMVQLLLDSQANVDAQDRTGKTALMEATIGNHVDTVEKLLIAKANVQIKDNNDYATLAYALRFQDRKIANMLEKANKNSSGQDKNEL